MGLIKVACEISALPADATKIVDTTGACVMRVGSLSCTSNHGAPLYRV